MILLLSMVAFAIVDLSLAGFRAAAGRSARIRKLGYFVKAMGAGALAGVLVSGVLAGATLALLRAHPDGGAIYENLLAIGGRMWLAFVAFLALVFVALAAYAIAKHEVRTLASTLILGPFTLARPLVIAGATLWGVTASETWIAALVAIASSGAILGASALLDRLYPNEAERLLG